MKLYLLIIFLLEYLIKIYNNSSEYWWYMKWYEQKNNLHDPTKVYLLIFTILDKG